MANHGGATPAGNSGMPPAGSQKDETAGPPVPASEERGGVNSCEEYTNWQMTEEEWAAVAACAKFSMR